MDVEPVVRNMCISSTILGCTPAEGSILQNGGLSRGGRGGGGRKHESNGIGAALRTWESQPEKKREG